MTSTELTPPSAPSGVVRSLTGLKHLLYLSVAFFSFLLFIISSVVATYEKDTYGGYNPPLGELAFTGAFGTLIIPLFVWCQKVRPEIILNSLAAELALCLFMWIFLLAGAGALNTQTYALAACQNLFICRGFSTVMAFAWISWIIISVMMIYQLMIIANLWSRRIPVDWLAPTKEAYVRMKTGVVPTREASPAEKAGDTGV